MRNFEDCGFGKKNHSRVVKSVNFVDNVDNRYYESPKHDFSKRPTKPILRGYSVSDAELFLQDAKRYEEEMKDYELAMKSYKEDVSHLENEFREDLMDEYGLRDNPKESTLFEIAWEQGHHEGFYSVIYWYDKLSELIK